jgi:hypothetical protein
MKNLFKVLAVDYLSLLQALSIATYLEDETINYYDYN